MQAKKVRGPEPAVSVMVNKFLHLNMFAHDRRTPLEHRRPTGAVVVVDSSRGTWHHSPYDSRSLLEIAWWYSTQSMEIGRLRWLLAAGPAGRYALSIVYRRSSGCMRSISHNDVDIKSIDRPPSNPDPYIFVTRVLVERLSRRRRSS